MYAIASAARARLDEFVDDAQYLVMIADLDLPRAGKAVEALDLVIDNFFGNELEFLDAWPASGLLLPPLREKPLRSFGAVGTGRLLRRMGVGDCGADFRQLATQRVAAAHGRVTEPAAEPARGDLLVEKTWTFAAYDLAPAGPEPRRGRAAGVEGAAQWALRGEVLKDNGFKNAQMSPFLKPPAMYVHEWVDRAQCGEYQALAEICAVLGSRVDLRFEVARKAVLGAVQVYVVSAPCLSCMSCFRQFQLLLPGVALRLTVGAASARSKRFLLRV